MGCMSIQVRHIDPPLMRPQPPEVWSHLVAFVQARLAEREATPDVLWSALDRLADLVTDTHNPKARAPGESDIDTTEAMWHLASTWRDHDDFRALLDRDYDRFSFGRSVPPCPGRERWIRNWQP